MSATGDADSNINVGEFVKTKKEEGFVDLCERLLGLLQVVIGGESGP